MPINQQLKDAIASLNLTPYGAAQLWGADNERNTKANHKFILSLLGDSPPKTIQLLQQLCDSLDLKIEIKVRSR